MLLDIVSYIITYAIISVPFLVIYAVKLKNENAKLKSIIKKDINIFEEIAKSNLKFEKDFHDYMESLRNDIKEKLPKWADELTTGNVSEMRTNKKENDYEI